MERVEALKGTAVQQDMEGKLDQLLARMDAHDKALQLLLARLP